MEGYQLGYAQLKEDSVEGDELRTILKTGADNLLRRLISYNSNHWLPQTDLDRYRGTALDLLDQIEIFEEEIRALRRAKKVTITYVDRDLAKLKKYALEKGKAAIATPKAQTLSVQSPPPQLPLLLRTESICSAAV